MKSIFISITIMLSNANMIIDLLTKTKTDFNGKIHFSHLEESTDTSNSNGASGKVPDNRWHKGEQKNIKGYLNLTDGYAAISENNKPDDYLIQYRYKLNLKSNSKVFTASVEEKNKNRVYDLFTKKLKVIDTKTKKVLQTNTIEDADATFFKELLKLSSKLGVPNSSRVKVDGEFEFSYNNKPIHKLNINGDFQPTTGRIDLNKTSFNYNPKKEWFEYSGSTLGYDKVKNTFVFNNIEFDPSAINIKHLAKLFTAGFSINNKGELVLKDRIFKFNFKTNEIFINGKWRKIKDTDANTVIKMITREDSND